MYQTFWVGEIPVTQCGIKHDLSGITAAKQLFLNFDQFG